METSTPQLFFAQGESPRLILFIEHPFKWPHKNSRSITQGHFQITHHVLEETPLLIIEAQTHFLPTTAHLQQMCSLLCQLPRQIPFIYLGLGNGLVKKIKHGNWAAVCDHILLHTSPAFYDQIAEHPVIADISTDIYPQELLSELCNAGFLCGIDLPMCTAFHHPNWQQTTPAEIKFAQQSQAELITSRLPLLALINQSLELPTAGLLCIANCADKNGFFSKTHYDDDDYHFFMKQAQHLLKTYLKLLSSTEQSTELLHLLTTNKSCD